MSRTLAAAGVWTEVWLRVGAEGKPVLLSVHRLNRAPARARCPSGPCWAVLIRAALPPLVDTGPGKTLRRGGVLGKTPWGSLPPYVTSPPAWDIHDLLLFYFTSKWDQTQNHWRRLRKQTRNGQTRAFRVLKWDLGVPMPPSASHTAVFCSACRRGAGTCSQAEEA